MLTSVGNITTTALWINYHFWRLSKSNNPGFNVLHGPSLTCMNIQHSLTQPLRSNTHQHPSIKISKAICSDQHTDNLSPKNDCWSENAASYWYIQTVCYM